MSGIGSAWRITGCCVKAVLDAGALVATDVVIVW